MCLIVSTVTQPTNALCFMTKPDDINVVIIITIIVIIIRPEHELGPA